MANIATVAGSGTLTVGVVPPHPTVHTGTGGTIIGDTGGGFGDPPSDGISEPPMATLPTPARAATLPAPAPAAPMVAGRGVFSAPPVALAQPSGVSGRAAIL